MLLAKSGIDQFGPVLQMPDRVVSHAWQSFELCEDALMRCETLEDASEDLCEVTVPFHASLVS